MKKKLINWLGFILTFCVLGFLCYAAYDLAATHGFWFPVKIFGAGMAIGIVVHCIRWMLEYGGKK